MTDWTPLAEISPPIALGPLDGRYRRTVAPLVDYLSEPALNRQRLHVEVEWFIHLCATNAVPGTRALTADEVALMSQGRVIARGTPAELITEHAGRETAEVYASPDRRAEIRSAAEEAGLDVRAAGPAIAIVGCEKAPNGLVPDDAVIRPASLEDVFVLLTGEELE